LLLAAALPGGLSRQQMIFYHFNNRKFSDW
jgi:hypothetical protein